MNLIDRAVAFVSPERALKRVRARQAIMHYDAATVGQRASSWKASSTDADAAAGRRDRMAYIARDMVRNTPFALRAQQVIANNAVGDGIIPKGIIPKGENDPDGLREILLNMIENTCDKTVISADGRQNLYGLQRLAMNTITDAGEVLVLREYVTDPRPGQFKLRLRVLEPDFLDTLRDGVLSDGGSIHDGIEYNADGQRVAYHLFDQHPGTDWFKGIGWRSRSRRVPAQRVLHIYRQDRPGQNRGVSWFAPIALALQDLGDYQDAQIMRQKIAACFAAFHKRSETLADGNNSEATSLGGSLSPGLIQSIASDEEVTFSDPPDVAGYDTFTRTVLLSIAAGMGITYEALVGDLSNVNFSSARMGRMEMDRNVSSWQWLMLIPQMMHPIGDWLLEEWALMDPENARRIKQCSLNWVPPYRILVDPAREIGALREAVRAGFASRQGVVRQLGSDPERLIEEQEADAKDAEQRGLVFDSDPAAVSQSGVTQTPPPADEKTPQRNNNDGK